ncbi:MAG: hypothetical protein J5711_03640 [Bacteroidales bacterium]|nr:hypothetical protein [Bacteroidales bacterium]
MKKTLTLILFMIYIPFVFAQIDELYSKYSEIYNVLTNDSTTLFYSKKEIPYIVKKIIKERYSVHFWLADPGKSFNSTDVITYPFFPRRQLLFGGRKKNYIFFVYRKGGRSTSTYFVFFDKKTRDLNIYNVSNKISKPDDLIQAILEKKYYPVKV